MGMILWILHWVFANFCLYFMLNTFFAQYLIKIDLGKLFFAPKQSQQSWITYNQKGVGRHNGGTKRQTANRRRQTIRRRITTPRQSEIIKKTQRKKTEIQKTCVQKCICAPDETPNWCHLDDCVRHILAWLYDQLPYLGAWHRIFCIQLATL